MKGTKKQIEWAEQIIKNTWDRALDVHFDDMEKRAKWLDKLSNGIDAIDNAKWWIDNRAIDIDLRGNITDRHNFVRSDRLHNNIQFLKAFKA